MKGNAKTFKFVSVCLTVVCLVTGWIACSSQKGPRYITSRELGMIIDLSDLTPAESKRLEKVFNSQVSPCGDDVTIAEALANPTHCPLVLLASRFIVDKIKEDYNIQEIAAAYVSRFALSVEHAIPVDESPYKGADNPIVTIVVFADFECPLCAKTAETLHDLMRRYPDEIRLIYKHFVLESHPLSEHAARAAFAAHRQGRFWAMHDTLFSAIGSPLSRERIATMADGIGLDMKQYEEDGSEESRCRKRPATGIPGPHKLHC